MMNEFNRNENEMNENKRDDQTIRNMTNEPAAIEPKQEENTNINSNETAETLGNDDTAADLREPAAESAPVSEPAPAQDGTYSITRRDIPNPTYSAQPRPQNPQPSVPAWSGHPV